MGKMLDKAIVFATKAHEGQYRKGTQTPYILHPLETAAIVATLTNDEEVISAALLHDVIEDTAVTGEEIREAFGERVYSLVMSESENKREGVPAEISWKTRKSETLDHLKDAPLEVKMITLGDKLSNIRAISRDYATFGDALWQRFNQKEKREHAWYYKNIAECLYKLSATPAFEEYFYLIQKTFG